MTMGYSQDDESSVMSSDRVQSNHNSNTDTATPSIMLQNHFASTLAAKQLPSSRHRNRSPFSKTHSRSRSSGSVINVPVMIRAHSMPAVNYSSRHLDSSASLTAPTSSSASGASSHHLASHSPQRSPARVRSPLSAEMLDNSYFPPPRSPRWPETPSVPIVAIQEDSELDLTPRNSLSHSNSIPPSAAAAALTRPTSSRRRPASPLYNVAIAATSPSITPTSHPAETMTGSPSLQPMKYNENFPSQFSLHHYASTSSFSSISSTPSSARSRSPSISSLDTIEDAPDAESEALEADRLWRLRLSVERSEKGSDDSGDEGHRRKGFGFGRGRSERKRWSVCGGERRADLDLETIWED